MSNKVDLGWLNSNKAFTEGVKITQNTTKVTEKSEAARREYWSEFYRKKNHIAQGCVHW